MPATPAIRATKRLTPQGPVLILSQGGGAGPLVVDDTQARALVLLLLRFYGATKQ